MDAARTITNDRRVHWRDNSSWQHQIDLAISTPDPVLANLRITAAHHELSLALRRILGPEAGANFHTWATWGSKKAGVTIRQDDVRHLRSLATLLGGGMGRRTMSVGRDVSPLDGGDRPTPDAHAELEAFLRAWDRTGGSLQGSRVGNWADIRDRMNFICALFRTGQCDEGLFTATAGYPTDPCPAAPYRTGWAGGLGRAPEGSRDPAPDRLPLTPPRPTLYRCA